MRLKRGLLLSALLVSALVVSVFDSANTYAAQITARSLTLVAGATDGGSKPGGVVNHRFNFTVPGSSSVGSIKFEYCTTASVTACVTPTGISTTSATIGGTPSATGWASGATINNSTNGAPYLTRTATSAAGTILVQFDTITNPTAANYTFFVRITTHASTDGTGAAIDNGTVAASTATQVILTGTMPESLIFCVGETISTTLGIPDCTTATAGDVEFNQLFSPTDTATATSQMSASTNAASGYSITINGPTLTSGANTIPIMGTSTTGVRGTGQFGLNLRLNTTATSTVAVGADVSLAPDGTNLRGQPSAGYDTVDNFKFTSGDVVAQSNNGGAGPTNAQIFTSSYIVNVAGNQASGTYTTTLTYICTATF